jgi:hypothetical protein
MADELHGIRQWLTHLGEWAAHPGAYGILVLYIRCSGSSLIGLRSIGMALPL